jgi:predicted ester cyclase
MSKNKEQPDADTSLKLMQGRWFHVEDENSLSKHQGERQETNISVRESTTLTQTPESTNLLNQFLAVVLGQVTTRRTEINQDLREQNIAIMRKYIEYENSRDYENMENLFHPTEFRSKTYFGNDPISPKAHTRMLKGLFRAFPDWFMVINEIISADDVSCVALITGRGTQYEEFWGRPPADHQIAIPTLHAIKVNDGLIVEHRHINPFENIFANQIMAPLTEDIMAVRAQQGFDSSMAQRAYDAAVAAGAREEELGDLKLLIETKRRQCQVLLKGTLRRCAMIAAPGELYCEHHQEHGYGIDGIE